MKFNKTDFPDLVLIEPNILIDDRGLFSKTFNSELFQQNEIDFIIAESYYSISNNNVIRGMHFQIPPHQHNKLVYVTKGRILDVVIDLRIGSPTFKKCFSSVLSEENRNILYVPIGFAHGFKALENDSCIVYCQDSVYSPNSDSGIHFESIDFEWNNSQDIIVSKRDSGFDNLKDFNSLFTYNR